MTFNVNQIEALSAPLDRAVVKTNPKGHSYVEAYHAENEANRIFGFDAWDRTDDVTLIGETLKKDKYGNDQHWVYYRCKVRITVRTPGGATVIREGQGYGSGIDKDLGQAHESALKEAESDAEKRALKTFGNPFGQALYDKEQSQVADVPPAEPKPNLLVTAAMTAITVCETVADLKAWHMKNADGLKALTPAEQDEIARHYKARAKAVAPRIEDDPFRDAGPGGVAGDDHPDREFNTSPGTH